MTREKKIEEETKNYVKEIESLKKKVEKKDKDLSLHQRFLAENKD